MGKLADSFNNFYNVAVKPLKTKLDGIAVGANNYTHPTTSGNKHIPAGGSSGQILRWSADGTAAWGADNNTTYTPAGLGQGYGTCATAAATAAKVVTLSNYVLTTGGVVSVKFTYNVPASATMNVNSKGAKAIYYKGAAITANVIQAGDVATFIYDGSYYHLIAIDRVAGSAITGLSISGKTITYTLANGSTGTITTQDTTYTHPTTSGNKHIPTGGSSGQILRWSADGTAAWGADNNTTYSAATQSAAGLMSAADKTKLDGVAAGANKTVVYAYTFTAANWSNGTLTIAATTHGITGSAIVAQFYHSVDGAYLPGTWACVESWAEINASTHVITLHGPSDGYAGKVVLIG